MPYVAPGPSAQCIPRKAVASTVLEQTRRNAAAGKSSGGSGRTKEESQSHPRPQDHASSSITIANQRVEGTITTDQLAEKLEVAHIEEPGVPIPKSASSSSVGGSSSYASSSSSAVSPTLSGDDKELVRREAMEAVSAYKAAIFTYTRDKLLEAQGTGMSAKKEPLQYNQFGSKQSGMQKIAAKKALARQLNA